MAQELKILGNIFTSGFSTCSKTCIEEFDAIIIDTNILIDSPECILEISKFTKVIIPVECINELNILKGTNDELNDKVNHSLTMINELKSTNNNFSIVLLSRHVQTYSPKARSFFAPEISDVDIMIIQYAKYLYDNSLSTNILILSKDKELQHAIKDFKCNCSVGDINSYYIPQE